MQCDVNYDIRVGEDSAVSTDFSYLIVHIEREHRERVIVTHEIFFAGIFGEKHFRDGFFIKSFQKWIIAYVFIIVPVRSFVSQRERINYCRDYNYQ